MPRVRRQKASGRAQRVCGALGCGKEIPKGEEYYTWSFRYGGRQVRCLDHPPRPSDLTQSRMGEVYTAIEEAEKRLVDETFDSVEDVKGVIEEVATVAREVADAYREAAENFGGGGPNAERADELEVWVDELENFEPDEPEESEFNEEQAREKAREEVAAEMINEMDLDAIRASHEEDPLEDLDNAEIIEQFGDEPEWTARVDSHIEHAREEYEEENGEDTKADAITNAEAEASELLGQCPL